MGLRKGQKLDNIIIRKEEEKDYEQTELMTMRAFWNIHEPGCNEHYLVHIIRKSKDYLPELSRVAELNGKIIGAIFYTKAWIDDGNEKHEIVSFGPLAIEPTVQNLGVGRLLLEATIPLVKEAGYPGICMFGEPDYYPKRGFSRCKDFEITTPEGKYSNALLGLETTKGSLKAIKGKFIESQVFEDSMDDEKVALYNQTFPKYPMYKVPSQWLHGQKLGKIIAVKEGIYTIAFWEKQLFGVLQDAFQGDKPSEGDLVTFTTTADGKCTILTLELKSQE